MTETYVIGIGGTGSRCIESFVHLSAAGLGPDTSWLGLVDQDQANGNVVNAAQLISKYREVRGDLRQLDQNILSSNCGLFRTAISTATSGHLWCPLPDDGSTLENIFRKDILKPELKGMFECLYSESEQKMDLGVGFRGKPHLGAAAILSRANSDEPYWRELLEIIEGVRGGNEVRIFLVASVFGGMGASGFPTIARLLQAELKKRGITSGVKIGGALFLPYFSFSSPSDNQDQDVARSEAFLEQAQGALMFYDDLMRNENFLDSLYLIGWSPIIKLPYHEKGGQNQINPPMIPELYGSLAAAHFFSTEEITSRSIYQIGRRNSNEVGWPDLPAIGRDPNEVANKLGQLIRFAVAYKYMYQPSLSDPKSVNYEESWFRSKIEVDLKDPNISTAVHNLGEYCDILLRWSASLSYFGAKGSEVNLFSPAVYAKADDTARAGDAELLGNLGRKQRKMFDSLIYGEEGPSLHRIFERMTYEKADHGHIGFSKFCGSLFDFSTNETQDINE